jgi:adenosylcobyric acid synthase
MSGNRAILVGGTSSNAGKSLMATAICAWLRERGMSVAPFKAQNMSNHSYPCHGGGEIGRAQVAQAEACGLEPETSMNPVLLKPNGDGTSQVILNGRLWKTLPARGYYEHAEFLTRHVLSAYADLARRFDVIVIEGAGSVSELNLRRFDLVNLGLATRIGAPWILVADIERGGVFASVIGSVSLLTPEERALFRGFMINKFRGDLSLFEDGTQLLEQRTQSPCLGVFPFTDDLDVDAEDSLSLNRRSPHAAPPGARVAVLRFPCLSNGTDFRLITWADWISAAPACEQYDFVILPGSKNTIADLRWMRQRRLDAWVIGQYRSGATVIGICGGYQMLGRAIHDPDAMESRGASVAGLGLLPTETVLGREKTTRVVNATTGRGSSFRAYEIHLGRTTADAPLEPFARLADGGTEGVCERRVIGTYLHGALENASVCSEVFGIAVSPRSDTEVRYRRLARWFARHLRSEDFLAHLFGKSAAV